MSDLAEILDTAERLEREYQSAKDFASQLFRGGLVNDFYAHHGTRLVAFARAAEKMRNNLSIRHFEDAAGEDDHQWVLHAGLEEALAVFDAVASGGEEKP